MKIRTLGKPLVTSQLASTTSSTVIDLSEARLASVQVVYSNVAPTAKTFDSQRFAIDTVNFADKAATTAGDYFVVYDAAGLGWAAAMNKGGSDPAPTGAIYTAIPAGRKVNVDISSATNDEDIAALVETAMNALTGFSAAFTTDDTAANGNMLFTRDAYGAVTAPVVKNADDSGAGSIAATTTTSGLTSEVSEGSENSVTIPSHGYVTGLKGQLTTTGTLPAGVTTGTDYFIIKVDANTVQFAASLADAVAGTAIDLTNEGTGVHTFTATASTSNVAKLQESNDGTNWVDVSSATVTIATTAGSALWQYTGASQFLKVLFTPSAGQISLAVHASLVL